MKAEQRYDVIRTIVETYSVYATSKEEAINKLPLKQERYDPYETEIIKQVAKIGEK